MFNKKNDNKKVDLQIDKLYQDGNLLFSSSLVDMMSNAHINKMLSETIEYQNDITSYINKKYENSIKKQYNPIVVDLYHNGLLSINNKEYRLKDFFVVFDDNLNNFHLKCINPNFNTEEIEYNKAVRFIDTKAFINLINSSKIINNRLIVDDINKLNMIVNNWDGYLHDETEETDAIINKKMIRDDINE